MSDIQILLSELIDKIEDLTNKVDILNDKIDMMNRVPQITWGDDSTPLPLRTTDEILPMKSIQEIRDEQKRQNS